MPKVLGNSSFWSFGLSRRFGRKREKYLLNMLSWQNLVTPFLPLNTYTPESIMVSLKWTCWGIAENHARFLTEQKLVQLAHELVLVTNHMCHPTKIIVPMLRGPQKHTQFWVTITGKGKSSGISWEIRALNVSDPLRFLTFKSYLNNTRFCWIGIIIPWWFQMYCHWSSNYCRCARYGTHI